jgi:hypothetical protein
MSFTYGANVVFGVIPEGPFFDRFLSLYSSEWEKMEMKEISENPEEVEEWKSWESEYFERESKIAEMVFDKNPELLEELCESLQAPNCCKMHWTGDSDDRPGRSSTDSESWVFGVGIYGEDIKKLMTPQYRPSKAFLKNAEMHSWVTAY